MMIKASIRRFHSPDVHDLPSWRPADPECFGFLLQVMVGPADSEGEESFDFLVVTPEWLRREHGDDAVVVGRHHLILFRYDWHKIKSEVESLISAQESEDWVTLAERLGRFGKWEFEDYREYPP